MARTMNFVNELYSVPSREAQHFLVDLDYLGVVESQIVLINSVLSIVRSLGYDEYLEEIVGLLREYVGEFLEALALEGAYVPGLASFLAAKIEKRLWESGASDSALLEFLDTLVGYRTALTKGDLDTEDAEELLKLTCHYLRVSLCEELERYLQPLTPAVALQAALTGLAISAGGIGV